MIVYLKTARGILNASLRDIKHGRWCKKSLLKLQGEDQEEFEGCTAVKDPMGCALGLISMHGGHGKEFSITLPHATFDTATTIRVFEGMYASKDAPEGVKRAVRALFHAIPRRTPSKRRGLNALARGGLDGTPLVLENDILDAMNSACYGYNDQANMSAERAAGWFSNALDTL